MNELRHFVRLQHFGGVDFWLTSERPWTDPWQDLRRKHPQARLALFWAWSGKLCVGVRCCRSCIVGAGDIEVWLGPGTCPPKIPVARLALNQKNWQAGRRTLISHQRWHHDTKWRDSQELHPKGQKGGTFLYPTIGWKLKIFQVSRSVVFREALLFTFSLTTAGEGAIRCTGACFLRLNIFKVQTLKLQKMLLLVIFISVSSPKN